MIAGPELQQQTEGISSLLMVPLVLLQVLQRRSSRDPTDTYLTAMVPRKDRFHRCCAVVTPFCASRCLREAVARGALYRMLPTSGAHQAHLLQPSQSGSTRTADELAGLAAAGGAVGGGMGGMAGGQVSRGCGQQRPGGEGQSMPGRY